MELSHYKLHLLNGVRHDTNQLDVNVLTKNKGLYAWFTKNEDRLVYIGTATGKLGLYGRIICQHLNIKYLEIRQTKQHPLKDTFQMNNPIYKNGKVAIDKSAFRKNVARIKKLKAGEESVNYLKCTFNLSFIILKNLSNDEILRLEKQLIAEFKPEFNVRGINTSH